MNEDSDGTNNKEKESCQNRAILRTRKVGVQQVDNSTRKWQAI